MMPSLPNELWWNIFAHAVPFGGDLAVVEPSSEQLYPFFQGSFSGFSDTHFVSTQLALWKSWDITVLNLMRVSRLWRGLAEPFLYSALYVEQEWRLRRFIDSIKEKPRQAEQLRTLVVMPRSINGLTKPFCDGLVLQVLGLCHGVTAVVMESPMSSSPLYLFESHGSSRRLRLLSALGLLRDEFPVFMINFNNCATLQVLELSVHDVGGRTLSSFPEHITFPSLHTLVLGYLDPISLGIVGKWELPSLKELSIARWSPLQSIALIPLIQQSYERLEFLAVSTHSFYDRKLNDIIRTPLIHLKHLTLGIPTPTQPFPPTQLAAKLVLCHVVTFGVYRVGWITLGSIHAWVRFLTYMPHLRSVLTDVTTSLLEECLKNSLPLLDFLRSFEEVLEARGVAFKGVTNDRSSFVPIKLLQRDSLEVSTSLFSHNSRLISKILYQNGNLPLDNGNANKQ